MSFAAFEAIKNATDRNVLNMQEAKEAGKRVVGEYCIYSPMELAIAAGAMPVSLCGTKNDSIPAAEEVLPRTLCPLIKSSFGFALQDSCPYLSAADVIVADTTCDGKKKMFELLAQKKPLFLLQLPQIQDHDATLYWRAQYVKLITFYEEQFGVTIHEDDIRAAISLMNRQRKALKDVFDCTQRKVPPLNGVQLLEFCFRLSFMVDKEKSIVLLEDLAREIMASPEPSTPSTAPRILLTGVPTGLGCEKVIRLLEQCGAHVVVIDNCSSYKKTTLIIDETKDPITALAERYLSTPCSVMSPNPYRYTRLRTMADDFHVDGVVDLTWQGCQTFEIESYTVKQFVRNELKLPFLHIVTDYSEADTEQLKVRIEAFLEMIG
ncbi:MAG: double-cubane-cluster-containing anaerobic reductase [Pseudomonadota bacterium]